MISGPCVGRLLTACLVVVGAAGLSISSAGAAAAAGCAGPTCYHYQADVSVVAWTSPALPVPVFPGSMHYYTARVTNTGWRWGGTSGPIPFPGPTSGVVYIGFEPSTPDDVPVTCQVDSGPVLDFFGYAHGLAADLGNIPSGTTYQVTVGFRAPLISGTYSLVVRLTAFQNPYPWTDYDPSNNIVTLTYQVGYQA